MNTSSRSIVYATAGTLFALVAGPLTAVAVVTKFSPALQGYYYAFGSLLTIRLLTELGFSQSIVQFVSHEWAKLRLDSNQELAGDSHVVARIRALARFAVAWYVVGACALVGVLVVAGVLTFGDQDRAIPWHLQWATLSIVVAAALPISVPYAFLQGINLTDSYWRYRFLQQVVAQGSLWVAILGGAELWAPSISSGFGLLTALTYLRIIHWRTLVSIFGVRTSGGRQIWRAELWPLQWRVAMGWLGPFLTSSLMTSIVFRVVSPERAGQYGLTMTLSGVIMALAGNWTTTRLPEFGTCFARADMRRFLSEFRRSFFASCLLGFLAASASVVGLFGLRTFLPWLGARLLPPVEFITAMAIVVVTISLNGVAVFFRSQKTEPFPRLVAVCSLITLVGGYAAAHWYGSLGCLIVQLSILTLIQVPAFWQGYRRQLASVSATTRLPSSTDY